MRLFEFSIVRKSAMLLAFLLIALAAAPIAAEPETSDEPEAAASNAGNRVDDAIQGFYILNFNRWGELEAPFEREQIIVDLLAQRDIERILIISYGWANDGASSYGIYRDLVRDLLPARSGDSPHPKTVVIGIGWDSSQTGVRKLANDLIPFPVLASWLAYIPDNLLFPISFWSKAAMADRIGYGGLRAELNTIFETAYPAGEDHPEIVLIGHSFGTRIVSGLMKQELALVDVSSTPFSSAMHVSAAMLIQPALVLSNMDRDAEYPVLVTQSRHDHANGFLFPLANLTINAYSFTSFEGIARTRIFNVVVKQVEERTSQAVQLVLPGFGDETETQDDAKGGRGLFGDFSIPAPRMADRPVELFQSGLAEGASIPFSLLYSAVTTPINYTAVQARGLWNGPHNHVMNTLAQFPVIEIFVDLAGDIVGREVPWGARSKGFLDLGLLNESSGRLFVEPYEDPQHLPVISLDEIQESALRVALGCELSDCKGLIFIDASAAIDKGIFGLSLENRAVDYTLGWLDPIGSHANYRNHDVVNLMARFLNPGATPTQAD